MKNKCVKTLNNGVILILHIEEHVTMQYVRQISTFFFHNIKKIKVSRLHGHFNI